MFAIGAQDQSSKASPDSGVMTSQDRDSESKHWLPVQGDRDRGLQEWNDTQADYPNVCLHELFERQVLCDPDSVALVCAGRSLTYSELNRRANQIAHRLRAQSVGPDVLVGLVVERSLEMIIGMLGILKAGGAYVPIDTTFPPERIKFMIDDARIEAVVTQTDLLPILQGAAVSALCLDTFDWDAPQQPPVSSPGVTPENLVYVIYTSGSTGIPKGVCIEHRNLVNYVMGISDRMRFERGMNFATVSTIAADLGNTVIFPALLTGGCLHIISRECAASQGALAEYLHREHIDVLKIVPSHLAALQTGKEPEGVLPRRCLILGGESSRLDWLERLRRMSPSCEIYNHYGPTETTVGVLTYHIDSQLPQTLSGTLPLGKPLSNSRVYILDAEGQPVPTGELGELYIAGNGVARGYLNRDDLTAERFIRDPFSVAGAGRMYRTGDRGRYLPSGDIEFCGRVDHQVKIHGYRVELGEIESALRDQPGVQDAVVTACEDQSGGQQLVGYVVPRLTDQPLWNNQAAYLLPDGSSVAHLNRNETDYIYNEIFVLQAYLRHGIAIQDGDCIVDAGSNIGLFSVFANRIARNLRIFCFEPNPTAFACLEANAETWGAEMKCLPVGLSRENTSAEMTVFEGMSLLSGFHADPAKERSVVQAFAINQQSEEPGYEKFGTEIGRLLDERFRANTQFAQLRTLSSVIAEEGIERIDLFKINVEKSELDVLQGICAEDWPKIRQLVIEVDQRKDLQSITSLLEGHGYEVLVEQDPLLKNTDLCYVYAISLSSAANRLIRVQSPGSHISSVPLDGDRGLTPLALRKRLKERLPQYMIPQALVLLEKLPLTSNGKIDRRALPAPAFEKRAPASVTAPTPSDTERSLVAIWKELLKVDNVGVQDDFFDLGGHSLLAIRVASRIRDEFAVELPAQALFEYSTIAKLAEIVSKHRSDGPETVQRIKPRTQSGPCSLSPSQERLWFLYKLNPSTPAYNIVDVVRMDGAYDMEALGRAIRELVRRHEILRTRFDEQNGRPVQIVLPELDLRPSEWDWASLAPAEQESAWTELVRREGRRPFDLSQPPLLRLAMAHCDGEEHRLLITIHHILADEWSMEIIQREIGELYRAFSERKRSPLPDMAIQYADYACWQRELLREEGQREQLAYWKRELEGAPFVLELPSDRPRSADQSFRGTTELFTLSAESLAHFKRLAREEQATLFMTLAAGFAALLNRYTSQDDMLIGTPISNRTVSETEALVGCFLGTVVLRAQFGAEATFRSLLRQMRDRAVGAYAHQDVAFDRIVTELAPPRDTSRSPLFQVMFILHDVGGVSQVSTASGNHRLGTGTSKFDLSLVLSEADGKLEGLIEYNTDLFDRGRMERMTEHLRVLLDSVVRYPDRRLAELSCLNADEMRQLVVDWNNTDVDYRRDVFLDKLFEAQAQQHPDRVAVVFQEQSLTYSELNASANRLAHHLRKWGVKPNERVAVCVERGFEMIVAVLAVLKAGGAYAPLDPAYPRERLMFMVEDSAPVVVITDRSTNALFAAHTDRLKILDLVASASEWNREPDTNQDMESIGPQAEDLAYVIYTSGSTGKPKGVEIPRSALLNLLLSMQREPGFQAKDTLLAVTTLSFDIAGLELYLPLIAGGRVVIASREDVRDPDCLMDLMSKSECSVMQATPATWRALIQGGWTGMPRLKVFCGGEELTRELAGELLPRCAELWNMYGPTETTVYSTIQKVTSATGPRRIGKPIANTQVYVLDAEHRPVPVGVTGELYIGGDGLARGYRNREDLTRERFVASPFVPGARMYRTGDLARWLPDGTVECLGRIDNQVKLRGFRIELGEIETRLSGHPVIRQAVAMAREDTPGNKRLVAYYTTADESLSVTNEELRAFLSTALPEYMVPATFVRLASYPLTPNGKVDRKALPAPETDRYAPRDHEEPQGELEVKLAGIWAEVLGIGRVGRHDNFFSLGGHSLLAVAAIARMRREGLDIDVQGLFLMPTIGELAAAIEIREVRI